MSSGYSSPASDNDRIPNRNPGPSLASIEQSLDAIDNQLASISMAQPGSPSVNDSKPDPDQRTNDSMDETEYSSLQSNLAGSEALLEEVVLLETEEEAENELPSPSSSGYAAERGSSGSISGFDGLVNNEDGGEIREVRSDDDISRILDSQAPPSNHRVDDEDDASISWRKRKKHFFVLSHAGKPIYSRYGDVHRLAGFSAILQAIVSFVENGGDRVKWVRAGKHQVVFLVKGPIYLVCISCTEEPYESLKGQLELFYGQMILILTKSMNRCFEKNPKFDMTPLLGGTDAIFSSLIHSFSRNPATFLHAYTCLPLSLATRQAASAILQDVADSNVLFAILMCREKVICLAGARKASLHADDILLLSNFVMSSESFRTSESFSPICLPRYNPTAFLHAHVHYFDVDTYLILLTASSDNFYHLKDCRILIENVLLKSNVLVEAQRSMVERGMRVDELLVDLSVHPGSSSPHLGQPRQEPPDSSGRSEGVFRGLGGPAGLWHFIYRSNYLDQYVSSEFSSPINGLNQQKRLYRAYQKIYASMHQRGNGPHRTMFRRDENYVLLCWITQDFEFYAAFDPLADKLRVTIFSDKDFHEVGYLTFMMCRALAIKVCNHVCRRVKDNESEIFIVGASPFAW